MLSLYDLPVVGCRQVPHDSAHIRVACLGYFSRDILLAAGLSLERPLQFNAINCADCTNRPLIERLKKDIAEIERRYSDIIPAGSKVIERDKELHYERKRISRRDFFGQIRKDARLKAQDIAEGLDSARDIEYRTKTVPSTRKALNAAFREMDRVSGDSLLALSYYDLILTGQCNGCTLCVGLCPTGSLAIRRQEDRSYQGMHFNTLLCTGCGLCVEACPSRIISLEKGFARDKHRLFTDGSMSV